MTQECAQRTCEIMRSHFSQERGNNRCRAYLFKNKKKKKSRRKNRSNEGYIIQLRDSQEIPK